jgi:hypothetical protein
MIKRIFISIFAASALFTLAACSGLTLDRVDPGYERFRPNSVALLPIPGSENEENFTIRDTENILNELFSDYGDYNPRLTSADVISLSSPESTTATTLALYLADFSQRGTSNPVLLNELCDNLAVEAVIIPQIHIYEVLQEVSDEENEAISIARVRLGLSLYDKRTNSLLWHAIQQVDDEVSDDLSAETKRAILLDLAYEAVEDILDLGPE